MPISIFGTPKPFVGKTATHQRNAIRSWALISGDVLLFEAPKRIAQELGTRHVSGIRCNDIGLPYIDDMFRAAQILAEYDLMVYSNADVILTSSLPIAIERAAEQFGQFLLVGRRWDVGLDLELDFYRDWESRLSRYAMAFGELHSVSGKDWFAFRRPMPIDILPFVVGRPMWDNHVLDAHLRAGVPVIDATPVITAVHPNHEYRWAHPHDEWAMRNNELGRVPSNQGRISEATWTMTADNIVRKV